MCNLLSISSHLFGKIVAILCLCPQAVDWFAVCQELQGEHPGSFFSPILFGVELVNASF